jgi:hypothetical protein
MRYAKWRTGFCAAVFAPIAFLLLTGCCSSTSVVRKRPALQIQSPKELKGWDDTFIPYRCGFSGCEGQRLVSDLDDTGEHPIQGVEAFFEQVPGFSAKAIVGVRLVRRNGEPVLIGRTTGILESVSIPESSYITSLGISPNWGRKCDLISIYVYWASRTGDGGGSGHLGVGFSGLLFYNYRRFQATQLYSLFEVTGIEGYIASDNTLRSLGVVRKVNPNAGVVTESAIREGPCGPVGGVAQETSAPAGKVLSKVRVWSDDDGLYGLRAFQSDLDGQNTCECYLFGKERGTPTDIDIGVAEVISRIAGKVDSTGVRVLAFELFDRSTNHARWVSASSGTDRWRDADDFLFSLPKQQAGAMQVPTARIHGFHGWVNNDRITSIGPFYAPL